MNLSLLSHQIKNVAQQKEVSTLAMKGTILSLFLLLIVTLFFEYYVPPFFSIVFYILLIYLYYKSENEPFWLAFFLIISDGFMGFFGPYTLTFDVLPGLPAVELSQIYVLATVIKASSRPVNTKLFYSNFLKIFLVWIIFLIVQGFILGLSSSLNIQLRLIKVTLPFALFYSIPRLFYGFKDYQQFFKYLFPIAITALIAQVFTITQGISLLEFTGAAEDELLVVGQKADTTYRVLFSQKILLITLFSALFYLAKRNSDFNRFYLILIVICNYLTVFFSATRGWFIGFSFIIIMCMIFAIRVNLRSIATIVVLAAGLLVFLKSIPTVNTQIRNASERLSTIKSLTKGDLEAAQSLRRIQVRSPRVLKKWRESRLTGWGYSDTYFEYSDMHVANQNMLLHGGIIGLSLFWLFIIYFIFSLFDTHLKQTNQSPYKRPILVPIFFLLGWLFIHSTSGQHFNLSIHPSSAIAQIVFFCFCATVYNEIHGKINNVTIKGSNQTLNNIEST